jgi:hypothetical protein
MASLRAIAFVLVLPLSTRAGEELSFSRQVAPLLRDRCLKCHSGSRACGDLKLTTRDDLLSAGATGPAVKPGKSADSLLFKYVRDRKMPPKEPLSSAEVELIRRWIDTGAKWEGPALVSVKPTAPVRAGLDWWSLQPIRRPAIPAVKDRSLPRNSIDAFLLAALEAKGLSFAPEADRRTLIRRVTFDLVGLPPTPEEIDAFVSDTRPDACERVVDRLLASPHYGERWARHWLDVVRFAESHGYEMNTLRPNAWPYRDYVIRAFNQDIPYRQFAREQLAGDEPTNDDPLTSAATGFLVAGAHDMVGNATREGQLQQRSDDLFDMVATTGTTFLGLTVGCARCHDHKFDPVSQRDFYALQAIFAGVTHAERELAAPANPTYLAEVQRLRQRLVILENNLDEQEPLASGKGQRSGVDPRRNVERFSPVKAKSVRFAITATTDGTEPCIDELELYGPGSKDNLALASRGVKPSASSVYPNNPLHRLEHLTDGQVGNNRSWISAERGKGWVRLDFPEPVTIDRVVWGRDRNGQYRDRLANKYQIDVSSDGATWTTVAGSADRLPPGTPSPALRKLLEERKTIAARIGELTASRKVYAGVFRTPDVTRRLQRGDVLQEREIIIPGTPSAVRPALPVRASATEQQRRLALAEWIAHDDNPLPARVLVNRLWHWHFGQGIVRTQSDFGYNGDRPSHPELLDWLAAEFFSSGGRIKHIHRLIVLSTAYRQAGRYDDRAIGIDAGNRLLWRAPSRRLEAEAVRDAMLQVSGALDTHVGGPGYNLWEYSGYVIVFKPKAKLGPGEFRRMIYQFKPRLQQDGTFGAFDCPDATATAPRRNVSTTPFQALNLLNDPFVLDQADRFATRVKKEAGAETADQIRRAFRLALGRSPALTELSAAEKLVREHGLALLCRALFNANEFIYVH